MEEEATLDELTNTIKHKLHHEGHLPKIKATLRSHIFSYLVQQPSSSTSCSKPQNPTPIVTASPIEHTLINTMIHDYLIFHGYDHTALVFAAEANIKKDDDGGYNGDGTGNDTPPSRRDGDISKISENDGDSIAAEAAATATLPRLYDAVELWKRRARKTG